MAKVFSGAGCSTSPARLPYMGMGMWSFQTSAQ